MNIDNIDLFVFDFDGVLTNNLVYTNEQGDEYVACSRSDGLAFDVLRKLKKPTYGHMTLFPNELMDVS